MAHGQLHTTYITKCIVVVSTEDTPFDIIAEDVQWLLVSFYFIINKKERKRGRQWVANKQPNKCNYALCPQFCKSSAEWFILDILKYINRNKIPAKP